MELTPAEEALYQRVAARVAEETAALPRALRELGAPSLAGLAGGEFSRIAALLPRWLAEQAPLADGLCAALGRAGLYAWWHAEVLDGVLDGARGVAALPLAQHALARALDGYAALGLLAGAPWGDLAARLATATAAYAEEAGARPVDPATVSDERLAAWTPALLTDRAAPFGFAVTAHLHLAGVPASDSRWDDLPAAVRCLTGARQIADDASDWLDDLRSGQLSWVAAGLIRAFRGSAPAAEGSLERLAGYELRAEGFWGEVERAHGELCAQALERLASYGRSRLADLVAAQCRRDGASFALMRERRAGLRTLFGAGLDGE
ncbi:MAG TPA: hypothetical protein PKD53_14980 [Chloroflexaceae bacterium]|nr:hypothetical protein [Chloroflexaceae bacterium]